MVSTRTRKTPAAGALHGIADGYASKPFIHGWYRPGGLRRLRRVFSPKVKSTARRISASVRKPRASESARRFEPEDRMTATHRGHGQSIGKGMRLDLMMAEFLGKETGYCKGRGGCMHIADFASGSLGANGIVGGGMPIAVGAALSQRMMGLPNITVCFFGDGATSTGSFHESVNLASVWKLPVLFVCVNNMYAMSTSLRKQANISDLALRGQAYGIKSVSMDGNDAIGIYLATRDAREYVKEKGPMLLVLNTYRWMGHSKSDANVYRTKQEIDEWKKRCPIKKMREQMISEGIFTDEELDAIDAQAVADVEEAVRFAESSQSPRIEEAARDVYA